MLLTVQFAEVDHQENHLPRYSDTRCRELMYLAAAASLSDDWAMKHITFEDALSRRSGYPRHGKSYGCESLKETTLSSVFRALRPFPMTAEPRTLVVPEQHVRSRQPCNREAYRPTTQTIPPRADLGTTEHEEHLSSPTKTPSNTPRRVSRNALSLDPRQSLQPDSTHQPLEG